MAHIKKILKNKNFFYSGIYANLDKIYFYHVFYFFQ